MYNNIHNVNSTKVLSRYQWYNSHKRYGHHASITLKLSIYTKRLQNAPFKTRNNNN